MHPSFFRKSLLSLACLVMVVAANAQQPRTFYELRFYRFQTAEQGQRLDAYFRDALVPALHRSGIPSVGVFAGAGNDTATDKLFALLVPIKAPGELMTIRTKLSKDPVYGKASADAREASFDRPAYSRIESVLLQAFPLAPRPGKPVLKGPVSERIYELRSYESASLALHENKVKMFNEGGEIALFRRLGFNAVFYASVISGSHMPNLMYMTSFDNMAEREAHWKVFGADPEWKKLVALPEYQHNVSHMDIYYLKPTLYSDF